MIELCSEYLSERCIWLYVLVMSRRHFRVNAHSIVGWMSRNSLLKAGAISEGELTSTWIRQVSFQHAMMFVSTIISLFISQKENLEWKAKCIKNGCNWTRTENQLVLKRTLNHLAKLTKWLSCVLSIYLYGAFDFMFLSCHGRISEWIHTL